jgi:hypothetical protein
LVIGEVIDQADGVAGDDAAQRLAGEPLGGLGAGQFAVPGEAQAEQVFAGGDGEVGAAGLAEGLDGGALDQADAEVVEERREILRPAPEALGEVDPLDQLADVADGVGHDGAVAGVGDEVDHVAQVVLEGGLRVLGEPLGGQVVGGDAGVPLAVDLAGELDEHVGACAQGPDSVTEGDAGVHVEHAEVVGFDLEHGG